jgi:hypothetical protein
MTAIPFGIIVLTYLAAKHIWQPERKEKGSATARNLQRGQQRRSNQDANLVIDGN